MGAGFGQPDGLPDELTAQPEACPVSLPFLRKLQPAENSRDELIVRLEPSLVLKGAAERLTGSRGSLYASYVRQGLSPLEAYSQLLSRLLSASCDPAAAAEILMEHISWNWGTPYHTDAPQILSAMSNDAAWRRFEAEDPIARREVAAHLLFRAACYEKGPARKLLMELGGYLVGEIVNIWLNEIGPKPESKEEK